MSTLNNPFGAKVMSMIEVLLEDSLQEAVARQEVWLGARANGALVGAALDSIIIRRDSTTAGSTATQLGIYVKRGRNVVVENNIIHPGTLVDNGVRFSECATLRPFSNRAVDQTLLRAFNVDTGKPTPELETDIEEAFML